LSLNSGHTDNSDRNVALVIKKRAIKLIKNTETVLSKKVVLVPFKDKGCGVTSQTQGNHLLSASDDESSKKKRTVVKLSLTA
jgi:hypothetical protein